MAASNPHLPGLQLPAEPPKLTEQQLQNAVIDLARQLGWKVAHFRPAQTKHGWRTPVQADGRGFPDLILARDRLIAAELKTDTGRLTDHQEAWLTTLEHAGVTTAVWRPADWWDGTIDQALALNTKREAA
jgi:VRR-NUC domain-containing protein